MYVYFIDYTASSPGSVRSVARLGIFIGFTFYCITVLRKPNSVSRVTCDSLQGFTTQSK